MRFFATERTASDDAVAEHPHTEPVPTDDAGLRAFIADTPKHDRWLIAAWLKQQEGGDWQATVDIITEQVAAAEKVASYRNQLRDAFIAATTALGKAARLHDALAGAELYDTEFAESRRADLARSYLADASRALDTYQAINPDGVLTAPPTD